MGSLSISLKFTQIGCIHIQAICTHIQPSEVGLLYVERFILFPFEKPHIWQKIYILKHLPLTILHIGIEGQISVWLGNLIAILIIASA